MLEHGCDAGMSSVVMHNYMQLLTISETHVANKQTNIGQNRLKIMFLE